MTEGTPAVSLALTLPFALDRCRVGLPVLAGIVGISSVPSLLAVPADLVVFGIGVEVPAVIFLVARPLATKLTANELVGTIKGKPKQLFAVATTVIAPEAAPNREIDPSF